MLRVHESADRCDRLYVTVRCRDGDQALRVSLQAQEVTEERELDFQLLCVFLNTFLAVMQKRDICGLVESALSWTRPCFQIF